jgi:hypothetical protein
MVSVVLPRGLEKQKTIRCKTARSIATAQGYKYLIIGSDTYIVNKIEIKYGLLTPTPPGQFSLM